MSVFSLSLAEAAPPEAALEISAHRVAGIVVETRGSASVVTSLAVEALPPDVVVPSMAASNLRDREAAQAAVGRVLERLGRPKRVGLVIADPVVKVSIVRLQQVPARAQDLDQVIRWQVRKSAPFPLEDAQVSYVPGARVESGQDFVVTVARRTAIADYESVCAAAGAHAGIVDLSTLNVVNTILAGGRTGGDWLLVNVAPDWASIAIMRGPDLLFFRGRTSDGDGTLADLVHQTAMYYEDRLRGAGFSRVLLCGAASAGGADGLRRSLAERLAAQVEPVDPLAAVTLADRIQASPAAADTLAPLVGMVLRGREVSA